MSAIVAATRLSPLTYPDVRIGRHVVIGEDVEIGPGSTLGHGVVLHDGTRIGSRVRIDDHSVIGKSPMRARLSAVTKAVALDPPVVQDDCLIGAHTVLYRGCVLGSGVLIADLATVREQSTIGDLTIIGRGVSVENQVTIGARCKIETGAYITALSVIEDLCFIAPEVTFTNDNFAGRTAERFLHFKGVTLRRGARVGANATVLPGLVIGEDAFVAAGSVVTRDVPARMVVVGSPARVLRPVSTEQLLEHQ